MNIYVEFDCISRISHEKMTLESFGLNNPYAQFTLFSRGEVLESVILDEEKIDLLIEKLQEIKRWEKK